MGTPVFQREPFASCPVTATPEKFGSIAFCPHQVQDPRALSSAGWTRVVSSWGCHGDLLASSSILMFEVSFSPR